MLYKPQMENIHLFDTLALNDLTGEYLYVNVRTFLFNFVIRAFMCSYLHFQVGHRYKNNTVNLV